MKKKYLFLIILFYLSVVIYGFGKVNNSLPNFIKERSVFSIYCKKSPFDFKIETKNYILKLNNNAFYKIKDRVKSLIY